MSMSRSLVGVQYSGRLGDSISKLSQETIACSRVVDDKVPTTSYRLPYVC